MKAYRFLLVVLVTLFCTLAVNGNCYAQEVQKEKVYEKVDVMPEYPGGTDALISYLAKNIQYPELAKRACIQGKVMVEFVVKKDGKISDVKMLKGIGSGCDEEAVRVVKGLSTFKPGKNEGKPVDVQMLLPVAFKLADK